MTKHILAFLLLACTGYSAQAQWAVYDYKLDQGVQSLISAVRGAAQSESAVNAKSQESVASTVIQVQADAEIERMKRASQHPDVCGAIAASAGGGTSYRHVAPTVASAKRGAAAGPSPRPSGVAANDPMVKSIEMAEGRVNADSPEVQLALGGRGACGTWVKKDSVRGQICTDSGYSDVNSKFGYDNADVDAGTLLYGPQKSGEPFRRKLTLDSTDQSADMFAVRAYRRNLTIPLELRRLVKNELNSDAGRQYMSMKDVYDARMSLADSPYQEFVMNRAANRGSIPVIEGYMSSQIMKPFVEKFLADNGLSTTWKEQGISPDEMLRMEAEMRTMNLTWQRNIALMKNPEVLLKEQVLLLAAQNLFYERLIRSQDHSNLLLGQIAASLTRQEMTPQLNALHAAAVR